MGVRFVANSHPLVVVVVLHWNSFDTTKECLESLKNVKYKNFKIIVVDNGSSNNSGSILSKYFPDIYFIYNKKNYGFAKGNNIGIVRALRMGAKYVLILNNDTVVSPDFIGPLVKVGEMDKLSLVLGGKIYLYLNGVKTNKIDYSGGKLSFWRGKGIKFRKDYSICGSGRDNCPIEVSFISGCFMMIKKEAIDYVGLFDERFFFGFEDVDYCLRVKKAGFKMIYVPTSVIWHKKGGSRKFSKDELFNAIISKSIFMRKHCYRLVFYIWWSVYCIKTLIFLEKMLYSYKNYITSAKIDKKEFRKSIKKGLKLGFSSKSLSSFIIPI